MNAKLNKRERRAQQLLAHYAACERLARYLGVASPDGKKISVALWNAEREATRDSVYRCNGNLSEEQWDVTVNIASERVKVVFGKLPPGFFVNGDPRGYALKINNDKPEGHALIEAVKLHTDWGGYGILSPEIDGD